MLVLAALGLVAFAPAAAVAQSIVWSQRVSALAPRVSPAMAYDSARGVTVLFGGDVASGYNGDTLEWNGITWTQRTVAGAVPPPRGRHTMAYDSARGVTVLFGGSAGPSKNDTWEWDGTTWTQRLVTGPSARTLHAMAFDAGRGVTVLFGGLFGAAVSDDTWEWNGTAWTQRFVAGPSARLGHKMAYDSARGVTVLFGGSDLAGVRNDETWEWNGTAWSRVVVAGPSPSPRTRHAMAYDSARSVTVLTGGFADAASGETWEWDGASWTLRSGLSPGARVDHTMAFDAARSATFLAGGNTSAGFSGEMWGLGAPCVAPVIVNQDYSQIVCPGATIRFGVTVEGTGPFFYQWRTPAGPISPTANPSAATATLSITGCTTADSGCYDCLVTGPCGIVTSDYATAVVLATRISTQPATVSACLGARASFSVIASGSGTLGYQWRRNNVNIAGATGSTYSIAAVAAANAGSYTVVVTGGCGSVTSSAAALTVSPVTSVAVQPASITRCAGAEASFVALGVGTGPFQYQWRKGSTIISGATTATYTIPAVTGAHAGGYNCVITGGCTSATTSTATLTVNPVTAITAQPTGITSCQGTAVTLRVTAVGSGTLGYQWLRNGAAIAGARSATYTIASPVPASSGTYSVVVTGACGTTTSSDAVVSIDPATVISTQPASLTRCAGTEAAFTVAATGAGPISYQWRRNGVNIPGATAAGYTIGAVASTSAGSYTVVVTGRCGSQTSSAATLVVNPLPAFTLQPIGLTRCAGSSAVFNVTAVNAAPTAYQWRKDGVNISGATTSRLTISSPVALDAGVYDVTASNGCGTVTSAPATLVVNTPVVITAQPLSLTRCTGTEETFTVSATGSGPLTYQWRRNGVNIPGETASAYTFALLSAASAGSYTVVVTGPCGSVTSAAATLTVPTAAVITSQPAPLTRCAGTSASFSVVATGSAPLTYQWRKDGTDIPGATAATYGITASAPTHAGSYTVVVTNACGGRVSNPAAFVVNSVPVISGQPQPVSTCTGSAAGFSVAVAPGSGTIGYQWRRNGANIAGATAATYSIPVTTTASAGTYSVTVTGPCGATVISTGATLTLNAPTSITTPPTGSTVCVGATASVSVVATGSGTLSYRWRKGPDNLSDGPASGGSTISGAATPTLTITTASLEDFADYSCVVTSTCGGTATTQPATVTVVGCALLRGACSPADIAGAGDSGHEPDGQLDGLDLIAFINSFMVGDPAIDPLADLVGGGSEFLMPDGVVDGEDFIAFMSAFAVGC